MNFRLKDYYRILEIPPTATAEEIKKSFRKLALKYHPDKNSGSAFAEAQFIELKEAHQVLSDKARRYKYDEERWLLGMSSRSAKKGETNAVWIRGEAARLLKHIGSIDVYRMNHTALQQYVLLLLSDAHIAILEKETDLKKEVAVDVIQSVAKLKMKHLPSIMERLKILAGDDSELIETIELNWQMRSDAEKKEKYFSILIISIIITIVVITIIALAR